MEITPRFEGYWTQLVRTVNVVEPNQELAKLHRVARDAIKKRLDVFKPGKTIRDVVLAMDASVRDAGYLFKPPTGHICGVDLIEARISAQNTVLEPAHDHPSHGFHTRWQNSFRGETTCYRWRV
jgi:Xaa-Pro aminopeptidase